MVRILFFAAIAVLAWKAVTGRWPWQGRALPGAQDEARARRLLGVSAAASQDEILGAHRRLVASVHPDRGGSNAQVHEANAARDLLLARLPHNPTPPEA